MHGGTVLKGVPFNYQFEALARRWHTSPYAIERELDDPLTQLWVQRGLIFMGLEAVEVRHG